MINSIKTQLNIIFHKKGFLVTFVLILLYAMSVSLSYAFLQIGEDASQMYHPAMLSGLNADSDYIWFFCRLYPFLVVIPAGYILFADQNAKIYELFLIKENQFKYYSSKMFAAFLATFIVFTVPFLLEILLNLVIIPPGATMAMTNWETYGKVYFEYADAFLLNSIFYKNIFLYSIVSILLTGLFSGCVSVFIVGISTFQFRYRSILLLPFYTLLYIVNLFSGFIKTQTYLDLYIATFDLVTDKSIWYFIMFMLVLLSTGIGSVVFNIRRGMYQ